MTDKYRFNHSTGEVYKEIINRNSPRVVELLRAYKEYDNDLAGLDIKRLKCLLRSNSPWEDDFDKDTIFMDDQFRIILDPTGNFDIEPVNYKYKTDFIKHRGYKISIVELDPQNFDDVLITKPVDLALENEHKSLGSYTFSAGEINRIIRNFDSNALALALREVLFNSGEKIFDENITELAIKLINKIR